MIPFIIFAIITGFFAAIFLGTLWLKRDKQEYSLSPRDVLIVYVIFTAIYGGIFWW